jgi:hypothetical protein
MINSLRTLAPATMRSGKRQLKFRRTTYPNDHCAGVVSSSSGFSAATVNSTVAVLEW